MVAMFHQHWGDILIIPDTESGIAALEREQITKPRALEIDGAKLHQPNHSLKAVPIPENIFTIDPLTLHTIQLLDHSRKLKNVLHTQQQEQLQQQQQDSIPKLGDVEALWGNVAAITTALPVRPEFPKGFLVDRKPGDISNKDGESDFVLGKGVSLPELSYHFAQRLLRKTVAAVCAHAGFETSSNLVLDTLSSVVHEYFLKMCKLLRVAVDREALTGSTGFVDVMEEVFHELGLGSVTSMHSFYQKRIVGFHRHVTHTCQQLEEEFELLRTPQSHGVIESIKGTRTLLEEPRVSEIQFPSSEDILGVNGVPGSTIQTGEQTPPPLEELQGALQGIEGSTSLKEEAMKWLPPQVALFRGKEVDNAQNTLDPDEEIINVSDTPEPASGSEMEPSSVNCDPLTFSPGETTTQICKPPKKKKKK